MNSPKYGMDLNPKGPKDNSAMREMAILRGQKRSELVKSRVRSAMALIVMESKQNGGAYPLNGGAVSLAEVARRADVHVTTLFSPTQRELGAEVRNWLLGIKSQKCPSKNSSNRRDLATRISDWKILYDGLAQSHNDTELALQQAEAELIIERKISSELRLEISSLRELLRTTVSSNVFSLVDREQP